MHLIYDVSHNIAKVEEHVVDGKLKTLLVHRKGSTRAFPPHHPLIPVDYQLTGQPVLIGIVYYDSSSRPSHLSSSLRRQVWSAVKRLDTISPKLLIMFDPHLG